MDINTEKILGEIDKVGEYLSERLQVPVEKAYEILMKQVYFELSWNIVGLVIGILLIITSIIVFRISKRNGWIDICSNGCYIYIFCGYGSLIAGIIFFFVTLYNVLQIAINPEWYMIQMILEKIS